LTDRVFARRAAGLATSFPAPHFPSELDADTIAFDSGFACAHLLPDLTRCAEIALTACRDETLQYSANQGQPELRAWIADFMNRDGCRLTPEELMIVNGAKHGIELVCRLLLDEGDAVVVTAPTYFSAIPIFRSFGARFLEVEQDGDGIRIDALEQLLAQQQREGLPLPKLVYNVADFHNPTGVAMSTERRQALLEFCQRYGLFVVEDNPYRSVRFEGVPRPTLKALDATGNVIHTGTFSKLIAPGLRIGWVAARRDLIARMIQLKSDGGTSALLQRIVYEFCRSDAFEPHVQRVQQTYVAHRDRMVEAIRREMPGVSMAVPSGGYYLWLTLPSGLEGDVFAARAAEAGVNLIAGSKFFANGGTYPSNRGGGRNHVRLSYSFASVEQIDDGVQRLGRIYRAALAA
jgi:2-aminoadipate transaminase